MDTSHSKKLMLASSKQIQIYELINKIQNVLNTENLLPRECCIEFNKLIKIKLSIFSTRVYLFCQKYGWNAKKMARHGAQVQGSWIKAQFGEKHLPAQNKWTQVFFSCFLVKKSCDHLVHWRVDVEIHHEKRLHAENRSERLQNELDKLQKQFDLFKEILMSDNNSAYQSAIKRSQLMFTNYSENNFYDDQHRITHKSHANLNGFRDSAKCENKENQFKEKKRFVEIDY